MIDLIERLNASANFKGQNLTSVCEIIKDLPDVSVSEFMHKNYGSDWESTGIDSSTILDRTVTKTTYTNTTTTKNRIGVMKFILLRNAVQRIDENLVLAQKTLNASELTRDFPAEQLCKLFVDAKDWDVHKAEIYRYENEPGYTSALFLAFHKMGDILSSKLNFELIKLIHDICIDNVIGEQFAYLYSTYYCTEVKISNNENGTINGVREVMVMSPANSTSKIVNHFTKHDVWSNKVMFGEIDEKRYAAVRQLRMNHAVSNNMRSYFKPPLLTVTHFYNKSRFEIVENFCNVYECRLTKIKSDASLDECAKKNEIISAIAEVCRNIQFTHPFYDGNARTIGCILVNGLLMKEGFYPSIIPNANVFDAYDVVSLVDIIKQGQNHFINILYEVRKRAKIKSWLNYKCSIL